MIINYVTQWRAVFGQHPRGRGLDKQLHSVTPGIKQQQAEAGHGASEPLVFTDVGQSPVQSCPGAEWQHRAALYESLGFAVAVRVMCYPLFAVLLSREHWLSQVFPGHVALSSQGHS